MYIYNDILMLLIIYIIYIMTHETTQDMTQENGDGNRRSGVGRSAHVFPAIRPAFSTMFHQSTAGFRCFYTTFSPKHRQIWLLFCRF